MSDESTILVEKEDGIMTVTLNRPDRLNAFTGRMSNELREALADAGADDGVAAVIFTGAGRGYCAGADMAAGEETFSYAARDAAESDIGVHRDSGGLLTLDMYNCPKPLIAAINGPAVGIGITMCLAMDIRLASEQARFGFVFARRGIVPEAASSWFLPRLVGVSRALEWCYSGRVFDAREALEGGLVRQVLPPEMLLPRAREIAAEIRDNCAPVSVALIRQMMWRMLGADHPMEAHRIDSMGIQERGATADAAEGVKSFLEKRPPQFPLKVSGDMPAFYPWWQDPEF